MPANNPPRAAAPQSEFARDLGPLTELAGTWAGGGFNVISLPDFDSHPPSTGPKRPSTNILNPWNRLCFPSPRDDSRGVIDVD